MAIAFIVVFKRERRSVAVTVRLVHVLERVATDSDARKRARRHVNAGAHVGKLVGTVVDEDAEANGRANRVEQVPR